MTDPSRHHPTKRNRPPAGDIARPRAEWAQTETVRLVCAALGLACLVLAIRIASIW